MRLLCCPTLASERVLLLPLLFSVGVRESFCYFPYRPSHSYLSRGRLLEESGAKSRGCRYFRVASDLESSPYGLNVNGLNVHAKVKRTRARLLGRMTKLSSFGAIGFVASIFPQAHWL
jgi:hypothetical protein